MLHQNSCIKGLIVLNADAYDLVYGREWVAEISRRITLIHPPLTASELHEKQELLSEVDVIFSGWGAPLMDEAFLLSAPRLKAVFYAAGSVKGFATEAFWSRDIAITSAYAQNAIPVAEYALSVILLSLKQFWYYANETRRLGKIPEKVRVAGAYRSRIGLISLGVIARLLREHLRAFDVEVLVYDPYLSIEQAKGLDVKLASLEELFETSDVVSLHTPWLKETENMIRGTHFQRMKSGATFLNTARGAIVNEPEMIDALQKRPDLTAVLDVTWPEPPVVDSPLYKLPNVVLTPHIAGSLDAECRRMGDLMIKEFDRWKSGESLVGGITHKKMLTMA